MAWTRANSNRVIHGNTYTKERQTENNATIRE